ncbi:MAG: winged helix-turn-helix domain-containing protein [Candidatus Thorarchaeota archaeon]
MRKLNKAGSRLEGSPNDIIPSESLSSQIQTPFDDLIPVSSDRSTQFYLDAMRIYLGLCTGSLSMESAIQAVDILKENPEYTSCPTNPTLIPINERYKSRILENLKTITKFNLITRDSIKSAFSFAFLSEEGPINKTDYEALLLFTREPEISLVDASKILGITPRTIARSIQRLKERYVVRFSALLDYPSFNLQSAMLFFTLREGAEWSAVEECLTRYPFTKSILKTTMTDLGYVTFLVPNIEDTRHVFQGSIRDVSQEFFEYASLHYQTAVGTTSNLSLLRDNDWTLPSYLGNGAVDFIATSYDFPPLIQCGVTRDEFTQTDLAIAAQIQSESRAGPSKISSNLRIRGVDVDARRVAKVDRTLRDSNLLMSYVLFGGLGLSSNFCFEIVCNDKWKQRILPLVAQFPWVMYYVSNRGVIVWTMTPGSHQVDYYQMFRALEQNPGVELVHPIMTIAQGGSKTVMDLTRGLTLESGKWSVRNEDVDLTICLPEIE